MTPAGAQPDRSPIRLRRLAGLAVLLSVLRAAHAAPPCDSSDACLRAIETSQRATRVLTARFEQIKYLSLLSQPLVSRGRFAFRQPDQVLWQIDDPPVTVRIDRRGIHLPAILADRDAAAALDSFGGMLRQLSGLFTGSLNALRRSFSVEAAADATTITVHLVPQPPEWRRMFPAIDASFALPDIVIQRLRLEESLGDHLEITFSDVHRNDAVAAQLAAASFDARPPRD